jgi:hypothetical protein
VDGGHERADERRRHQFRQLDERLQRVERNRLHLLAALERRFGDLIEARQLQRPLETRPHQHRTERRAGQQNAERAPRPGRQPRGVDRIVHLEDRREPRRVQHRDDRRPHGRQTQIAAHALRGGVPPHQRADPRAVDGADAAHVHDEILLSSAEDLLNVLFERFGGAPGNEGHLR